MIVVMLITSISTIMIGKGAQFVRNFRLKQEKQTFEFVAKRAKMWVNIQDSPLEISFFRCKDSSTLLKIDSLKFRKSFNYMILDEKLSSFTLYPDDSSSLKDVKISWLEK